MEKIDIDKFIISLRRRFGEDKGIATRLDDCLRDQHFKFVDTQDGGMLTQLPEPFEIEKGKWYMCISDMIDSDTHRKLLEKGKVYQSKENRTLRNDDNSALFVPYAYKFVRPATPEEMLNRKIGSKSDQEDLTEFEKTVGVSIGSWNPNEEGKKRVKAVANKLLSIARKQIASEMNVDEMVQKFKDNVEETPHRYTHCLTFHDAYKLGMNDTLKAIEKGK